MQLAVKFIIGGWIMVVGTVLTAFLGFQNLVEFVVKDQSALRKRNEIRGIYLHIPFPLNFKVYFFNVTNPMDVQNGSKPILKQIGPYVYDEHKNKINVVDNDGEDSLQYDAFDNYEFNKERSGNLSDEDYITIINPILVGMVNKVASESPALLSLVNQAISHIFRNPQSIYITDKVKNILFEGMELDCTSTDFTAKAVCTQLKSIPGLKESKTQKGLLLYSLIGSKNATIGNTIKIKRGIKNYREIGKVMEVDGKKKIDIWGSDYCNHFRGTDGWIIPPLLNPEDGIQAFSTQICRNIELKYVRDDVIKGINVRRYEGNLGDQTNNEIDKCYCPTPKTCLKKGLFDASKCLGAPIYASLPHFLNADESLLTQVEGLNPSWDDHILNINIEPMTSAPLKVRIRIQMSLGISPQPKISVMKSMPTAIHPMFWLEDGLDLEGPFYTKISTVFTLLKLARIMRWFVLAISFMILGWGYFLYFKNKKSVKITPVHHGSSAKDDEDSAKHNSGFTRSSNELMVKLRNEMNNNRKESNNIMTGHEFDRYG